MSKKDLKVGNLSKYRYRELKYLCLQYSELKDRLRELSSESIKATQVTGMPSARNITDSTQDIVIRKMEVERKIKAIEQAALAADSKMYTQIIINVTEGIPPRYLHIDCPEKTFYNKRRIFFNILDKKI